MIITAYKVDCCGNIVDKENAYGVIHKPDMFDADNSFPTVDPDKSQTHYCVNCYTERVVEAAKYWGNRKTTTEERDKKRKELAYVFKKSLFSKNILMP